MPRSRPTSRVPLTPKVPGRSGPCVVPNAGHAPVFGDDAPRFAETATSFLRGGWQRAP
jgi:hypothetical protein